MGSMRQRMKGVQIKRRHSMTDEGDQVLVTEREHGHQNNDTPCVEGC